MDKRKITLIFVLLFVTILFSSHLIYKINEVPKKEKIIKLKPIKTLIVIPINEIWIKPLKLNKRKDFLNHIGFIESDNNYTKINSHGYLGKYQFGKSTLKTIKYKGSIINFLNSPELQENMMIRLLKYNKKRLHKHIEKYEGKVVNGILITESGILAAAHLAGQGNVKRYFKRGKITKDNYGTSLTKYLKLFGGYELDLE